MIKPGAIEDLGTSLPRRNTPFIKNEHGVRCQDGSSKWILDRGKVIQWDGDGRPLRRDWYPLPILIERHQMEQALRQQAEMLQAILDHIPIMVVLIDAQGRRPVY